MHYDIYADDTQFYVQIKLTDPSSLDNLAAFLFNINSWEAKHSLKDLLEAFPCSLARGCEGRSTLSKELKYRRMFPIL